jgi:hypothetical protein
MKTKIIPILLILQAISSYGQDWQLFPYKQRSFYEINDNSQIPFVETVINDSISETDGFKNLFFNTISHHRVIESEGIYSLKECLGKFDSFPNEALVSSAFFLTSGFTDNNTTTINGLFEARNGWKNFTFIFKHAAKLNDNFVVTGSTISFTCDSISELSIFGEIDSVKYFTINKGNPDPYLVKLKFVLSKNYGLIEFALLGELLNNKSVDVPKVRLIGYEKDGLKYGRVTPQFEDFFHLSPGDELEWYYYDRNWMFTHYSPISFYYDEKITNVSNTVDGVIYEVYRSAELDSWYPFQGELYFMKADYKPLFTNNTHNGSFSKDLPYFENRSQDNNRLSIWYTEKQILNDSVSSIAFKCPGSAFDPTYCDLLFSEQFYGFTVDTRFGVTKYWDGEITRTLIGATINGRYYELADPVLSISEIEVPGIEVYPNPFYDKLNVQTGMKETLNYHVIDVSGNVLQSGKLEGNHLDFGNLKNGIYTLVINDKEKSISKRVLKVQK